MRTLMLASALALLSLNGCATYGYGYHHHGYGHHAGGGGSGIALLTGILVGEAISSSLHDEPSEPIVVTNNVYVPVPAPVGAPYDAPPLLPPPPPPVPQAPSLNPIVAHNALHAVDLRACDAAQGAPIGYGHAKVTFDPDGSIKEVVVDSPAGLRPEAVRCIGDKLGAAHVPEFRGPATTAGYTFRVESP